MENTVTVDSQKRYIFNSEPYDVNTRIGVNIGIYVLKDIPQHHPIGFAIPHNYSDKIKILHTNESIIVTTDTKNGIAVTFYYGTIKLHVIKQFDEHISYYCGIHDNMGGENKRLFT